jgi:DNA-binding beta-propeller fold protein YncE
MTWTQKLLHVLSAAVLLGTVPAYATPKEVTVLELETKIPLGAVRGRIDHLAIDLARHRLFVAELGNGSLGVVDLSQGKLLRRIDGLAEPQGVAYFPATDTVYLASGGDGSLRRFKGDDLAPLGVTELGEDADNVRIDARAGQVVVGYGDGALALVDAASGAKVGDIALPGHPEAFQVEAGGSRVFVNVPTARQIAVADRDAGRQVATWKLAGRGNVLKGLFEGQGNFPMALDEAHGRLLVVDRNPPELLVFDTGRGELVARLPTCGDADDVFLDTKRGRAYVSCGEGFIAVVQRRGGDTYEEIGRVPTASGARTALFVPELDQLFLAVRASGGEPAAVWAFRSAP